MATSKSSVDCLQCPLRRKKAFRELNDGELQFVSKFKIGELDVDAQSSVLMEKQATPHVYTVLEGVLYRHRTLQDRSRQILNFSMPGDIVGLQLAMMGEIHHSVTALTPAKLCVFERNKFYSLFSGHPELAHSVTWIAATQETLLDNTIVSLGQRNAYQRIAHFFAQVYSRAESTGVASDGLLNIPIRNHHISEALGITPVHVSRTLNKLKRESVVERSNGYFSFPDLEKLAEVAAFDDHMPPTRPLL